MSGYACAIGVLTGISLADGSEEHVPISQGSPSKASSPGDVRIRKTFDSVERIS